MDKRRYTRSIGIPGALCLVLAAWLAGATPALKVHADTLGGDPSTASTTWWFNWVDHASPGFNSDNVHIVNPGGGQAAGTVTVPGVWSATFSVGAGAATYVPVPYGVIGGPAIVQVTSGPAVLATQRVQYMQSFSEIQGAGAANAMLHGWFPWYDRASPGTTGDNLHVVNPGGQDASGVFTLAGAQTLPFGVPAGGERYFSFPAGTINGPLRFDVTAGPPVIVAQRVQYSGSFNEVLAQDGGRPQTTLYFNWFDTASQNVVSDNIHVVNPAASGSVNVKVTAPGFAERDYQVAAGNEAIVSWPGTLGGPVRVDSDGAGVLATQRLQWPPAFAEWPGLPPASARSDTWFPWYDDASPGFIDDVHVTNPGSSTSSVTLTLPGTSAVPLSVPAGADVHYTYPKGTIGGPLRAQVTSGPGVLVDQRAFLRPPPTDRFLNVPLFHQQYALSCEEAALRMALAYEGINVSEDQIFSTMGIDYRAPVRDSTGFHWGDPYAQFVGDPNGSEINNTGYGSYNEAVARTASSLGGSVVASGEKVSPSYVYDSILDGHPVIVWVPFDWSPHSYSFYTAFDGRWVRFGAPYEHAVTVIGVNSGSILVNNPWQGQQWISKAQFENAYGMFDQMAVVIR